MGGGGGGLCGCALITNMIVEEKGDKLLFGEHAPGPTANKYLVSHLGFLLVASPEPALVEILHKVHYRKFVKVTKVAVWNSSCLEKSLFGNSQIGNGMALTGHRTPPPSKLMRCIPYILAEILALI